MDNWFLLYLLTLTSDIDVVCGAVFFIGGFACLILTGFVYLGEAEDSNKLWKLLRRGWTAVTIAAVIGILTPSQKDVFFIVGGSALMDVANSDQAQRIGSKSLEAVESWLDQNMPKKDPAK